MDFKIWCWYHGKRYRIYDPEANIGVDNPSLSLSVNEAGELSFVIHPTHAAYGLFNVSMISQSPILYRVKVRVMLGVLDVFHGRLYSYTLNNDTSITVKFEGDLAVLSDSQQRPENDVVPHTFNVADTVERWIRCHNAYTGTLQQINWLGGGGDVTLPTTVDNYNDTLSRLKSKIIDVVGGYLCTEYSQNGDDYDIKTFNEETGAVNLWYEETHNRHSSRPLRANLFSDFSASYDGTDYYNAIIPLGAKAENEYLDPALDNCLTIGEYTEDINGNPICNDRYMYDSSDTEFIREKSIQWSDEESKVYLQRLGILRLRADYATFIPELTIKALDPGFVEDKTVYYSDYRFLDWVTVFDELHGVQGEYQIVSIDYDIGNPTNSTFVLSASGVPADTSYTKKYAAQIKALQAGQFNTRSVKSIIAEINGSS